MILNTWDAKPQEVLWAGQLIEVFYRSALAKALNREIGTIRAMENKGVLCHPILRDGRNRWLYTRDQIMDLITLAEEEKVIDPRFRNPFSERFIREAHVILSRKPRLI